MIYDISIKQSDQWGNYLKSLGWNIYKIDCGALVATYKTAFGGLMKIQRPPLLDAHALDQIEQVANETKAMFVKIEPCCGQDTELLKNRGYVYSYAPLSVPSTIYLDLAKSETELWDNISHSGKYAIHRAQREGARVEFYQKPNDDKLMEHYQLCKQTGKRKHFYVQPFKEYSIKRDLYGDESFLALVYDKDGSLNSGKFFLGYKGIVTYLSGGSTVESTKNKSGYELLWRSILYFKNMGYKIFDLEGKDDPRFPMFTKDWGGFTYFKEKFGGTEVEFPHPYILYRSPLLKTLSHYMTLPL
jgi:lipid II:glycine glycyltransferase (peptidoglycan interpeptide bridge formation enzyme)